MYIKQKVLYKEKNQEIIILSCLIRYSICLLWIVESHHQWFLTSNGGILNSISIFTKYMGLLQKVFS